ncbi:Wadjet anti-phage system protein JetD domain-containing protein [Rathayibacter soli]|uniref:Wadjet anti-phage system protein JetD domain-containing protein n=1 Tax=Rathayibacter soli TaxID=3144168 RepID=UPI0027E3D568|nr:Wadjet anti-phage system protein JetD domain-containing protein [Glaciibacter superstes]
MKTHETIVSDVRRRLEGKWHAHLVGDLVAFPYAFPLGRATAADLHADYAAIHSQTVAWQDWARSWEVTLDYETRVAKGGTRQSVPTHAHVESIEHAAAIAGGGWPERLDRGRERLAVLRERYPGALDIGRTIRLIDGYSEIDFALLLTVAVWYLADPAHAELGVTPRQVPIPGVHAKWLQNHRAGVQALTGLEDLGLLPGHPPRIHFTYLDPDHRAAGGRIHDSATVGDRFAPAYVPELVVISENKDTAVHFPPLAGGISVEGVGRGGKTVASFRWIREAPVVVYWGDIDRDGYEILNGYRVDFNRDIESILMDPETYDEFEQYGTDLDQYGKALTPGVPKQTDQLRADERAMYLRVLDEQHRGHRRIEQERITLGRAIAAVQSLIDSSSDVR